MEENQTINDEVRQFFKALVDVDRLRVIGLLALHPDSPQPMADALKLQPKVVMRHLEALQAAGLVQQDGAQYNLNTRTVEGLARRVLAGSRPSAKPEDFEGDDFDRKVMSTYSTPDGRLKQLPTQEKKLLVVLRHLQRSFEPGQRYSEKQVNEILSRYNEDTAALRRYLVDYHFMERDKGIYWLREA